MNKNNSMNYWLIKSEPSTYSIDHLKKDKKTAWTGVRNYQARNTMRDLMQVGDLILFYHSTANPSGVAGIAKVASKPYADPTQFDKNSEYYDAKATKERPIWILIDVSFEKTFKNILALEEIKKHPKLKNMVLTQKGSRLSVQPVKKEEYQTILQMSI